jgi:DNA-binding beta-propeller fold protein YncE
MKTFRVQARVAACVGAIVLLVQISQAQAQTYSFVFQFGSYGSGDGQFNGPDSVAVDAAANIYVADRLNNRIQVFDSQGNFLLKFGSLGSGDGQFADPLGVFVDATGNIYVADYANNRIQVFDSLGNFLLKFGSFGSGDGQFSAPTGVAVDATGNIFVSDYYNSRIEVFDSQGTFLLQFGGPPGDGYYFGVCARRAETSTWSTPITASSRCLLRAHEAHRNGERRILTGPNDGLSLWHREHSSVWKPSRKALERGAAC